MFQIYRLPLSGFTATPISLSLQSVIAGAMLLKGGRGGHADLVVCIVDGCNKIGRSSMAHVITETSPSTSSNVEPTVTVSPVSTTTGH